MYQLMIKLRSAILVFLTHNMALPLLKLLRRPEVFPYTMEALQQFPANSLGKDLHDFLGNKQLALLPYYARHDMKHILLGYDTTDDGEVCLQCFMLGNGHISFPVLATVIYGLVTMPEHWKLFKAAYKRGKKAPELENWKWFELLQQETAILKQKINFNAKAD
ncbi:MAG: Coq4 family protein [Ferruginibacter sp.]